MNQKGFIPLIIALIGIFVISAGSVVVYNRLSSENAAEISKSNLSSLSGDLPETIPSSSPGQSSSAKSSAKPNGTITPVLKPPANPTNTPTVTPSLIPSPTPIPTRWPAPQNFRVTSISCSDGNITSNFAWDVTYPYAGFRLYLRNPAGSAWLYDKYVQLAEPKYTFIFPQSEKWNVRVAANDPNRSNPNESESNLTAEIAISQDLCP